jgi:hypothetical protein
MTKSGNKFESLGNKFEKIRIPWEQIRKNSKPLGTNSFLLGIPYKKIGADKGRNGAVEAHTLSRPILLYIVNWRRYCYFVNNFFVDSQVYRHNFEHLIDRSWKNRHLSIDTLIYKLRKLRPLRPLQKTIRYSTLDTLIPLIPLIYSMMLCR